MNPTAAQGNYGQRSTYSCFIIIIIIMTGNYSRLNLYFQYNYLLKSVRNSFKSVIISSF